LSDSFEDRVMRQRAALAAAQREERTLSEQRTVSERPEAARLRAAAQALLPELHDAVELLCQIGLGQTPTLYRKLTRYGGVSLTSRRRVVEQPTRPPSFYSPRPAKPVHRPAYEITVDGRCFEVDIDAHTIVQIDASGSGFQGKSVEQMVLDGCAWSYVVVSETGWWNINGWRYVSTPVAPLIESILNAIARYVGAAHL
jgi:hypothetical protein